MRTPSAVAAPGSGVKPWHLLLLGTMIAGTAGAVVTRGSGTVNTVAVIVALLTVALVAAAMVRTFRPLGSDEGGERPEMLAGRTRAAMEREKMLVLRSIKEAEFDRAMRKISDADYQEMVTRLRTRAIGLIRQLEGGGGYRAIIERDLATILASGAALAASPAAAPARADADVDAPSASTADEIQEPAAAPAGTVRCSNCGTVNDADARFCKSCGGSTAAPGRCANCGTTNETDARFCKSCGNRMKGDV